VALRDVLDDREPQTRAAAGARAAAVDAVEALGQARQVLARDAGAGVGDLDRHAAVAARLQPQLDAARGLRVAHRVVDEVADGALQFVATARQLPSRRKLERERVPALRERLAVDEHLLQQRCGIEPLAGGRARAAFQRGQRQQVGHQRLHALGLLRHQREHARALGLGQRQRRQRLDEARQHGERGADLVRDVGDEVAPHGVDALALGDVLRQQQALVVAVGAQQQGELAAGAVRCGHRQGLGLRLAMQPGDEGRRAHEVADALLAVALRVQAELVGRDAVAPFDVVLRVEQHDAVGRGLDRAQELPQALLLALQGLLALAQRALDAVAEFAPQQQVAGCRFGLRAAQPAQQARGTQRVLQQEQQQAKHAAAEDAGSALREARAQPRPQPAAAQQQGQRQQCTDQQGVHDRLPTPRRTASGGTTTAVDHAVADTAHGFDERGAVGRRQRLAQALDVHVDGALLDEDVVAPDAVQQLRARVHAVGVPHEEVQQAELGRPDAQLARTFPVRVVCPARATLVQQTVRGRVQPQRAERHRLLQRLRRLAPQHGAHARQQLPGREGLGEVVVGAGIEPAHLVRLLGARGQHDDGQRTRACVLAPAPRELQAALPGQHPVQQHQVGQRAADLRLCLHGVRGLPHLVAGVAQRQGDQLGDRRLVLDDQHHAHESALCTASTVRCRTSVPSTT